LKVATTIAVERIDIAADPRVNARYLAMIERNRPSIVTEAVVENHEAVAKANLIRRQEETAATRSLLNTARLMEENPLLLRLNELESLERWSRRSAASTCTRARARVLMRC
jgi:hypothetical protein